MRIPNRKIEVVVVLGVYLLFLLVGMYGGQRTFSVEVFGPLDGARLGCSPVELVARVTVRGNPVSDATARFTIHHRETGETSFEIFTDTNGVAELILPASSGNYTWSVSVRKLGYPTILSRSAGFSLRLVHVVEGLTPSPFVLAISPVTFKARVSDASSRLVDSANVTFYVDSTAIGSNVASSKGIAELSSSVAPGEHMWFASACKDGEGGISETISFLVGQAAALPTGELEVASIVCALIGSATRYPSATMMVSSSALKEKPTLERMTYPANAPLRTS